MKCDWCGDGKEKHTLEISFFGGSVLNICPDHFIMIQPALFGEDKKDDDDG